MRWNPTLDAGTAGLVAGLVVLAALALPPVEAQFVCGDGGCGHAPGSKPNTAFSSGPYTRARASSPCDPTGVFSWQEWSNDQETWHGALEVRDPHGTHIDSETVHDTYWQTDHGQRDLSVDGDPGTLAMMAHWEAESWYTGSETGSYSDTDSDTCL